jgi:SAM-dependent methyltransferase
MATNETYRRKSHYQQRALAESYLAKRFAHPRGKKENEATKSALADALAGLAGAKSILDMPCGSGRLVGFLREHGYRYCGADISMEMLEVLAREHGDRGQPLAVVRCDGEHLPFKDGAFDAVVCVRFLNHHIPPKVRQKILEEMRRVSSKWLVVQSQHLKPVTPLALLKIFVKRLLRRDVAKYRFDSEIVASGWVRSRRTWIRSQRRYIGVYSKTSEPV